MSRRWSASSGSSVVDVQTGLPRDAAPRPAHLAAPRARFGVGAARGLKLTEKRRFWSDARPLSLDSALLAL